MRVRAAGGALVLALSTFNAFGQTPQIAAISGRDELALHDLATGAELVRFNVPGGSSDLIALASGVALSNHTAGNEVLIIDLKRRSEIGRLRSFTWWHPGPVHMYLSPALEATIRCRAQRRQ
jgi:hypothetical protein